MFWHLMVFLAVLWQLGAGAPGAASTPDLSSYRVTRAGEVLFDRPARAAWLATLPAAQRAAWCGPARDDWRSHKAKTRLETPQRDSGARTDGRSQPYAWTVMTAAAAAFGVGDAEAREALIANLRRWARGEALTKLQDGQENTYYSLERTLLPTIVAYSLVRDDPTWDREEQKEVERWLNRLVRLRGIKRPEETKGPDSQLNNHRYLSDSIDMAWGALRGNDGLFQEGVASFYIALGQMRADGSLPLETARGASALWYQRHAIASLVAIAEMAAVQGYDLYAVSENGRSLHQAVDFLARALVDPSLVLAYAHDNRDPGKFGNSLVQDLSFMLRRGHQRHYMAWLEPYRARFPELEATRTLVRRLGEFDPGPRPMVDEFSGGATTCFFALAN
jgi:poly(beta-D-mannuronate) lyase